MSNGGGASWCDGWIWGLLGIRVLHDTSGTGLLGKPPPGTLMEDSVTPETFARRKDTYFVRTRRRFASETSRLGQDVYSFIHSSNLFQASAVCQALFRTLENHWWVKQSFCPHEAYVLRSVSNNQMNTWFNVKQHFHLMLLYSPLLLLLSHEVVSSSFVTPWTVCSLPGFSVHGIS